MALTSANLVGFLRAEFQKASRLRVALFVLQLATALPAAIAVVIPDHYSDVLYWLAGIGALLLLVWWWVNGRYTRVRNAGQGRDRLLRRTPLCIRRTSSKRRSATPTDEQWSNRSFYAFEV
jgi:cyanate permease